MRKKTISFIILLSIIFLLSSCDVTTLLDTFKGNVYEDVLDIDLVGDSAQEAADNISQALMPEEGATVLPDLDDDEKEELKSTIAKAKAIASDSSSEAFFESLEEEASEEQGDAAKNTADDILDNLDDLDDLDLDDDDLEAKIDELVGELQLQLDLPENPTQADVLNVQLASNLVNSLTDLFETMDDSESDDEEILDSLLDVVSDASFMLDVAKAQGSTSDLINSLDISQLMDLFADDSGSSSDSEDQTNSLDTETVEYLNAFRSTIDLVLQDILGVDPDDVDAGMDQEKFDDAIDNYKLQYSAFVAFLTVARSDTELDISEDDLAKFSGINGLITYTIATALVNVDTVFSAVAPEDEDYDTIEEIVDALIGSNTSLVYPEDGYTTDMEFILPGDLTSLGESSGDDSTLLADLGLEEKAKTFIANAIYLFGLGLTDSDDNVLLDALEEIQDSFNEED